MKKTKRYHGKHLSVRGNQALAHLEELYISYSKTGDDRLWENYYYAQGNDILEYVTAIAENTEGQLRCCGFNDDQIYCFKNFLTIEDSNEQKRLAVEMCCNILGNNSKQ